MEYSPKQATLGKLALGIKVTTLNGERISFVRASGRYFAQVLDVLTLYVGYLFAAFTERRQALHDMVAGTFVVHRGVLPPKLRRRPPRRRTPPAPWLQCWSGPLW